MNIFNKISFQTKVYALFLIPMTVLLVMSLVNLFSSYGEYQEFKMIKNHNGISTRSANLVHELQKERGFTAGFVATKGEKNASELREQRLKTDQALQEYNDYLELVDMDHVNKDLQDELKLIERDMSGLPGHRREVDGLNLSVKTAVSYYTNANHDVLENVAIIAHETHDAEIAEGGFAFYEFLQGKEYAGLERAYLNVYFSKNEFSNDLYADFIKVLSSQEVAFNAFKAIAPKEVSEYMSLIVKGGVVDEVNRLRTIAREKNNQAAAEVSASDWFRVSTQRIDLMHKVENKIASHLQELSGKRQDTTFNSMAMNTVFSTFALCFLVLVYRATSKGFGKLSSSIGNIAGIIYEDNEGETDLSEMLTVLSDMHNSLQERIETDRRQLNETTRLKQALDITDANIMVANANNEIVYMNKSVNELFKNNEKDIRNELPSFNADKLLNSNMDIFHKNPEHQQRIIEGLKKTYRTRAKVAGLTFNLTASPIVNDEGQRLGTVVEWEDLTQELMIEDDVQNLVDKALEGDLSHRVNIDNIDGFYHRLCDSLNQVMGSTESALNDVIKILMAMAEGDLTQKITADYKGLFDQLKCNTNDLSDRLTTVLCGIKRGASNVKSASEEISQGNSNLSQRTEEQAASLEQTASSMEQMTSTIQQNTENAREADGLASNARSIAESGGSVVNSAIDAMSQINTSSREIADIIGVIDEIAFQTNLLALNASVEAARAGEQGRGFAVVASEVRNLAGRSATAAKEIKELIQDSVIKVDEGSKLVNESGERLHEIVESIQKVSDIVAEISAASEEQSAGIEEVNKAVGQMDEMTQQNAALVEEVAATSEGMGGQAADLDNQIGFFRVNDGSAASGSSGQQERRAKDRPWKGGNNSASQSAPASSAIVSPLAANADFDGDEWEDF